MRVPYSWELPRVAPPYGAHTRFALATVREWRRHFEVL